MSCRLEPTIWSRDTGQKIPCFDRCQSIITWMSNIKEVHGNPPCIRWLRPQCMRQSKFWCPNASSTFHVNLNDVVYFAATNATRNEPIMGIFSYFFPKLNKYKGNIKILLTYSNTWLEIARLSSTKNKLFSE